MCCIYPRPVILGALEAGLVVDHAPYKGTHEQDLSELGARVQRVGSEIGVDFVEGCEFDGGEGRSVEVGGLEDEAGVGRRLEIGKHGQGEEHLGKVIDLEVGVYAILCFSVLSDSLASIAYKLRRVSTLFHYWCSIFALQHQSASRSSIALRLHPSSSGLSNHTGPSAPCSHHRTC